MSDPNRPHDRRVSDYIRGAVDEDQRKQLEIELLEDPQLFEQAQHEALFRRGLTETNLDGVKTRPWRAWLQPALTGALTVAVVGLSIANLGLKDRLGDLQSPRTGVPVITLHDQRALLPGMETETTSLSKSSGPVLLEIDVSGLDETELMLEIESASAVHRWQRVRPDPRGYLTVLLPETPASAEVILRDAEGREIRRMRID